MKYAQTLLEGPATRGPLRSLAAREQAGRWAEMRVTENGVAAWALVQLVEWRPAYGQSRWLVYPTKGPEKVVSTSKLRIIRSERVPLPVESPHLQPYVRPGDPRQWPPISTEWHPAPWND